MLEYQVERITRLLKALDTADGTENYVIHREAAISYVRSELKRIEMGAALSADDLTKEELQMSLQSLSGCPAQIKRKSDYEILEILMQTQQGSASPLSAQSTPQ